MSCRRNHAMPGNSIGKSFRVTTYGESHGAAIGCVIDGCPPGLLLHEDDLQPDLERAPSGQDPAHHAAPGDRRGADPLRRLRGRHHRHPDPPDDRERRSAPAGLHQDQGRVPALARGLHLPPQVRCPRLPGRRSVIGARDDDEGSRRAAWRRSTCGSGRAFWSAAISPSSVRCARPPSTGMKSSATRSSARTRRSPRRWRASWTRSESPATPSVRGSTWLRAACRRGSASRCSTASTRTSPMP